MRELPNLRKRALAVALPDHTETYSIETLGTGAQQYISVHTNNNRTSTSGLSNVPLPPGSWVILGRADEFDAGHTMPLFHPGKTMPQIGVEQLYKDVDRWEIYCTQNGLTNELILCEGTY